MNNKSRREEIVNSFRAAYNASVDVEVIPSSKDLGESSMAQQELVGPYCRVSTFQETQAESYELQKAYYEEYVKQFPNWTLVDIYADEGISATSMKSRKDLLRLIEDCQAGKVTRIITKQISRFARNVVDALSTIRMLRSLPKPVGVYFETENIDTLSRESDTQLALLASFAEAESIHKSTSMKWGIRNRFVKGIPRICNLYGYVRDGAKLLLDPVQSKIVRYIYDLFCDGFSIPLICEHLTSLNIPSPTGLKRWSYSSVHYILTNEKYCGYVYMQKTVCLDVFSHRSVRNRGYERQYRIRDHHDPIVSEDKWLNVQRVLGSIRIEELFIGDMDSKELVEGVGFTPINPNFPTQSTQSTQV